MYKTTILSSHRFVVWRIVYTVVLALITAPLMTPNNMDFGDWPGMYLLILGVLPSIAYLVAMKFGWTYANIVAYAHDSFLVIGSIVMLIVLPNYYAFILFSPLVGFAVEWIVASYCMLSARKSSK